METNTMTITAMHRTRGVDACVPAGTFIAPVAGAYQGTGLSSRGPISPITGGLGFVGQTSFGAVSTKATDVATFRTGEPPV